MLSLKITFWLCLFLVVYTYIGYGVVLFILLKIKRLIRGQEETGSVPTDDRLPDVTLMICAYNEADVIVEKMDNIRSLDYPQEKLHVMWVTDGTTDNSNELLGQYQGITLVFSPERRGKAAAMQHGLAQNKSEYVVFTDANTMLNAGAIREIVRLFMQPDVSCVSGEKRVLARHEGQSAAEGEGLYWKYESTLKRWDSELYSAMGAAGELFAIRMSDYIAVPPHALLDDFMMSMLIVKKGKRIAYTKEAYAMEYGSANMKEESKRKRRIAAGGLQSIWWLRSLMNPLRHPLVAFQFISHRVLRWSITPLAQVALIPLNVSLVCLRGGIVYDIIAFLQLTFYCAAIAGQLLSRRGRKISFLHVAYYFLFMNLNVFKGIPYLFSHHKGGTWEKAQRG